MSPAEWEESSLVSTERKKTVKHKKEKSELCSSSIWNLKFAPDKGNIK